MIEHQLFALVQKSEFAAALEFLNSYDDDAKAGEALTTIPSDISWNTLMMAACRGRAPEECTRAMVKRGPINYVNSASTHGSSAATVAIYADHASSLDILLTLGADTKGCHASASRWKPALLFYIALSSEWLSRVVSATTMSFIKHLLSFFILAWQLSLPLLRSFTIFTVLRRISLA
jgi:hypothetical protein